MGEGKDRGRKKYSQADGALKKRAGIIVHYVKVVDGIIASIVLHRSHDSDDQSSMAWKVGTGILGPPSTWIKISCSTK
jgi:hypothetical protein